MHADEARARLSEARVVRLSTVDAHGRSHVVPCCFVLDGDTAYSAIDDKPKSTGRLARLTHIKTNPNVTLLADHYDEDWSKLWWVQARGTARVMTDGAERAAAVVLLRDKYPQYETHALLGPVVAVDVVTWKGWSVESAHG